MRQREPRERDPEYMGFVAGLPCVACLARGVYKRGVHVAHLRAASPEHDKRYTGKGEKPHDRWTLPLCPPHHTGDKLRIRGHQHEMDEVEFYAQFGINPFDLCQALVGAYMAGHAGAPVIARFIAAGKKIVHG